MDDNDSNLVRGSGDDAVEIESYCCWTDMQLLQRFDRMKYRIVAGVTLLHYACQYGWLDVVQLLVEEYQWNPEVKTLPRSDTLGIEDSECGLTPLHYACMYGRLTVVKMLLKKYHCDPNILDYFDRTPLILACQHLRNKRVVYVLANTGHCKLNVQDRSKRTPLHYACDYRCIDTVSILIAHGANPNVADDNGDTPLHMVCSCENVNMLNYAVCLQKMVECNPNLQNKDGFTPLHLNLRNRSCFNPDIIKFLNINCKADPNIPDNLGNTPLHTACQTGSVDIVSCLLSTNCDPNIKNMSGLTPIQVIRLHTEEYFVILRRLIKYGANPNVVDSDGNTLLHRTCQVRSLQSVEYNAILKLTKCDPNIKNFDGLTPLQVTPIKCYQIINELLSHGANPNVADSDGNTPLHIACKCRKLRTIKSLLNASNCNPNMTNKSGQTALQVDVYFKSVWRNDSCITKELILHGADPNVGDQEGNTPLHNACYYRQLDTVKWLLSIEKSNPNVKNKAGLTPLHHHVTLNFFFYTQSDDDMIENFSVHHTRIDICITRELLTHGADPNVVDSDGNTPLHKACEAKMLSFVKCLLKANCDTNIKNKSGLTALQLTPPECSHIINELITHGANLDVMDNNGNTPLHVACQAAILDTVKFLSAAVTKNNLANISNKKGLTPLQLTSENLIIGELLSHGANPNVVDNDGNTPLHKACYLRKLDTVISLLKVAKCNPNCKNKTGQTPLQVVSFSFMEVDFCIMKELIAHGADPNCVIDRDGNTSLHNACYYRQLDTVKWLLSTAKCNPNVRNKAGLTPLQLHIKLNFLWYTQSDDDDTHHNNSPGPILDEQIIVELLTHGADPNVVDSDGNTPLHKACEAKMLPFVKCLLADLEMKCDTDIKNKLGCTPLQLTPPEYPHIVNELINHGANPNQVIDSDANTLLHIACKIGILETVICLLAAPRCDLNARNSAGLTPLQLTNPQLSSIIHELITHCANTNVIDSDGNTPLHIASQENSLESVKSILTAPDCDPNAENNDGLTPLQTTPICCTEIIKELIRHGANASNVYQAHGIALKEPLQPPVKVFVVGNPSAGKSTLTAALQKESSSVFGRALNANQKVKDVDLKTAGIVPHDFESKQYGYIVLFDFAGQREFYGSHAAVLQNTIQSSPPIFLVVVDLCEDELTIKKTILYWLTFLENQCTSLDRSSHIIFVGSHADVLKKSGKIQT